MSAVESEAATPAPPPFDAAVIDWGDTDFQPEVTSRDYDPVRLFRMSTGWPQKPFEDRKFQLGGKERVVLLEETVFVFWSHRFNKTHMGSAVNGTRRCTHDKLGECRACERYESSPVVKDDQGKNTRPDAHCGPRKQTFGCNLLVYKTDLEGNLLDEMNNKLELHEQLGLVVAGTQTIAAPVFEIFLWQFSSDKFVALREIKKEWGSLKKQDILFQLAPQKPENFQDFSPTVGARSVLAVLYASDKALEAQGQPNPARASGLVEYYKEHKYDVPAILGKEHTHEEMLGFLGVGGTPPGGSSEATADVARDIEQQLAALGDGATTFDSPEAVAPPSQTPPATTPQPEQPAPPPEPPAPPPEPPTPPPTSVVEDLDTLLNL